MIIEKCYSGHGAPRQPRYSSTSVEPGAKLGPMVVLGGGAVSDDRGNPVHVTPSLRGGEKGLE